MRRDTLTIQARYVFPVDGEPIEDGCLTIEGPRIGWVGSAKDRQGDLDLGNVAIAPGFVNAHTHLELAPLERMGRPHAVVEELSWLKSVIAQRRGSSEESLAARAAENVQVAIEAGTTLLADTTTAGLSWGRGFRGPVACGGIRRGDRPETRSGAGDRRGGLEVAGYHPPRGPGRRLRPGRPESPRALQHLGMALLQVGG